MSRGIKIFYVATSSEKPTKTGGQQTGDYCIVKSDKNSSTPRAISSATANSFSTSDIFQGKEYRWSGTAWVESENYVFTDDTILPNVTKIRKAHFDDIRSLIKAIQDKKICKYGDLYYNTHDFTNAVLSWSRNTDAAKIYFGDYGEGSQWLTLEFGKDNGSTGDRIRFAFRNGTTFDPVFDILSDTIHALKNLTVTGTSIFEGDVTTSAKLHAVGEVTLDTTLTVEGLSTFNGKTTSNDGALVRGDLTVEGGNIETSHQFKSYIPTETPPMTVVSTTKVDNLNADMLDGHHGSEFVLKEDLPDWYTEYSTNNDVLDLSELLPEHYQKLKFLVGTAQSFSMGVKDTLNYTLYDESGSALGGTIKLHEVGVGGNITGVILSMGMTTPFTIPIKPRTKTIKFSGTLAVLNVTGFIF